MADKVDVGLGFELEEYRNGDGELRGYMVTGPASTNCTGSHEGRCGGLVPTAPFGSRPVWSIDETEPLTLSPSIQCACSAKGELGQHGWIRAGRWVNAGGITA